MNINYKKEQEREDFIKDFYYKKLGFCGCGSPWNSMFVIKNLLNTIKERTDDYDSKELSFNECYDKYKEGLKTSLNQKETKSDLDSNVFDTNDGIVQILLNLLDSNEVLEHGSSVGGAWLTDYGKELLEYLNSLSDEDLEYIVD